MRRLCVAAAALFVASVVAVAAHGRGGRTEALQAARTAAVPALTTTTAPTTTTSPPTTAATTTAPAPKLQVADAPPSTLLPPITIPLLPPPTTAAPAPPSSSAKAKAAAGDLAPYLGLGTWVDVYDWSALYSKGKITVTAADVPSMVAAGVQTLYIQATKHDAPTDMLEPEHLQPIVDAAHGAGLRVVAWYLPSLIDTGSDLRRIKEIAALRHIDGIAIDIEAKNVPDVVERNRRLVELSAAVRRDLPGRAIGAIVLPPVALEVINPSYWPAFPYRQIAPYYDVWMTMGYWTNRTTASGYRDATRYTVENVVRLRNNLGLPDAPVHAIGGIGPRTTGPDVRGYMNALATVHAIGGSIYDWHTTAPALWPLLRGIRFR